MSFFKAIFPYMGMAAWTMVIATVIIMILPRKYTKQPEVKKYRRWVQSQLDLLVALSQKGPFYKFYVSLSVKIGDKCSIFIGERLSVVPKSPPKLFKIQTTCSEAIVKWRCAGFGRFHKQEYMLEMQKGPNISAVTTFLRFTQK